MRPVETEGFAGLLWDGDDMEAAVCLCENYTRGQAIAAWAQERGDDFTNGRARKAWIRTISAANVPEVRWCSVDHAGALRCWVVMPRHFVWKVAA